MKKNSIIKRLLTFILTLVLFIGLVPINSFAYWPGFGPGGNTGSGSGETSVDHIDIGVDLIASIIIDGVEREAEFTIGTSDAQYVLIAADPVDTNFSISGGVSTSTDNKGKKQIRIEGDFPVGTESNPISYTVTLSKSITTKDGYEVPVTLNATMHYWDGGNVCPGYQKNPGKQSGIDLVLNNEAGNNATKGNIQIQKTVEGVELKEDATFCFRLLDSSGKIYRDNIKVIIPAGKTMASVMLTNVDLGTYIIEEVSSMNEISGCALKCINYTNNGIATISTNDNSSIVNITSMYETILNTQYTIRFKDHDGRIISETVYDEGNEIVVPQNPTKPADKRFSYKFKGWNKVVSPTATEDVTYEAVYEEEYIDYQISFVNWDGSEILSSTYHYEDDVITPVEPTKPADRNFTYSFRGYVPAVTSVSDNQVYTAVYDAIPIAYEYSVIFKDWDGRAISEKVYTEGDKISVPDAPERVSDEPNAYNWIFVGWNKEVAEIVTESVTYTAQYKKQYINYKITFVNWDDSELTSETYHYGDVPTTPEEAPTRPADEEYTYLFKGYEPVIEPVTCDKIYKAVFDALVIPKPEFVISFVNWDGSVIVEASYSEGSEVVVPVDPERAADELFTYEFIGWSPKIELVSDNAVYQAVFKEHIITEKEEVDKLPVEAPGEEKVPEIVPEQNQEDNKKESPQTGDYSNTIYLLGLFIVSGIMILILSNHREKKTE